MQKLRQIISISTVFSIAMVLLPGLICPKNMLASHESGHHARSCEHGTILKAAPTGVATNCMNVHIGWLDKFQSVVPDTMTMLAGILVISFVLGLASSRRILMLYFENVRSRWKHLYNIYFSEVKLQLKHSFDAWLYHVMRLVLAE